MKTSTLSHLGRYVRPVLIYGLLSLASLVFAMPLLWMAGTSVKTGREIVESPTSFWPLQPVPRSKSPYLEPREFAETPEALRHLLPAVEARLKELGYAAASPSGSSDIPPEELLPVLAAGVLQRLEFILPASTWELPRADLQSAVAAAITPEIADAALNLARKQLCIGALLISSLDVQKQELVPPTAVAEGWRVETEVKTRTPGPPLDPVPVAQLQNIVSDGKPCALLCYDFADSDSFRLTQTFTTTFPVSRLYRIQLALLPDDSWNTFDIYVEKLGVRYKSSISATLGGSGTWTTMIWQETGSGGQRPGQIRVWTDLVEVDHGPQYVSDPSRLKITLELQRVGTGMAWWKKISRNYEMAFRYIPFWRYLATTLFVSLLSVITTVFSCSLVAYSFSRMTWPGRDLCFVLMLATMMVPSQVTMIPQFLIIRELGWYNSLLPLWVPHLFGNAFFIFLMVQFMKGVPKDLEDAARIDGCGFFRIYWHIMLPMMKPSLVTVGVLTFVATWNDFMGPLIYLNDQQLYTLSFGLYAFTVQAGADVGLNMSMAMAGALLMTLPIICLFLFAQRYFVQGVALTGMK